MKINENMLRSDTMRLVTQIEAQIAELQAEADKKRIPLTKLRNSNGDWAITHLLLAKAQAYAALAILQAKQSK